VPGSPAGGGGVPQPSLSSALQSYASLSAPSVLTPGGGDATAAQAASAADVPAAAPAGAGISVIGDVRTNSIIIFDAPRKREYYQRLIDALDVPQQLIEIEAYIVDVNRERLSEFGADLSLGSANRNIGIGTGVATLAAGALSNTTLLVQNLGHFFARLQMLESKGDARTLAKPRVLTLENLTAVLDMSQTVFLKATGERVANITQVTAGTLLRVTPRIIDEAGVPRVHLTVDIEDGSINAIPNSDTPGVQKSSISTQTMLDNQESLVIGGYDVDASGNRVSGIPGLSRIPMVGGLFGTSDTNSQSRQRLFIITPRLVKNGAQREREESALAAEPVVTLAPGATRLRLADRLGTIPVQDTTK
jgi:type III secretion protein C